MMRKWIIVAGGTMVSLLIVLWIVPVKAAPGNNPIFATLRDVQNAINTALVPLQDTIHSLQQQQVSQNSQISDLQKAQPGLKVFDANGQELGLVVNHTGQDATVFMLPIKKFIGLEDSAGVVGQVGEYYQSNDCSGTPYTYETTAITNQNNVLPFSPTKFYVINISDTPNAIMANSVNLWSFSASHANCSTIPQTTITNAYQLHTISLPFSTPVALPLKYSYQYVSGS